MTRNNMNIIRANKVYKIKEVNHRDELNFFMLFLKEYCDYN